MVVNMVTLKFQAKRVTTIALAVQLSLSLSTLAAFAEGDSITNSSLPLAQPSPSQRVQKIWSSLDVRKYAKKKESNDTANSAALSKAAPTTATAKSADEPAKAVATKDETATTEPAKAEAPSTSADLNVASKAPAANKTEDASKDSSTSLFEEASKAAEQSDVKAADTKQADAGKADLPPGAFVSTDKSANEITIDTSKVETAAPTKVAEKTAVEATSSAAESEIKSEGPIRIASNLIQLPPGSVLSKIQGQDSAVVIDNDEAEEVEETIKAEEMATDDGKTHAKAGARFPVVLASQINSKTAKKGDPLTAKLKYDLKIGDRLVAKKGSVVNGHVNYVLHARTIMHSLVSPERWYRNSGCLGLTFDEIVNEKGEHLPLSAQPSRQARIVKNKGEGRELGVNQYGQVTGPWAQQIRYKAIRIGLNAALAPAGVFSFGAMPVALGVLGAANPSFAFAKPVGLNVRHRRIKGFAWGFLSGIPGSWLIEDTTVKGQEAIIKPGDEFYAELVQEFTGEPASEAQLMPGATTKLHGQLLSDPKKGNKKKK